MQLEGQLAMQEEACCAISDSLAQALGKVAALEADALRAATLEKQLAQLEVGFVLCGQSTCPAQLPVCVQLLGRQSWQ